MNVQDILAELVSFPVFGGESNLAIIEWIESYLLDRAVETNRVPSADGKKSSLHCRIGPSAPDGYILSGHTDVVPVAGQDWTSDPFILTDKDDGKLYARGSCDMKGFIACCLSQVDHMVQAELKKPMYFAFSYDEEIGCLSAPELAASIRHHYDLPPRYAIIGEPSMMRPTTGQKGIYILDITVNGSAGHSSRIKQEVSAIHESAKLVTWLENKMNALVAEGNLDDRFTPPHSSLHVGMLHGGIAPNVIADRCDFSVDIRTIPSDSLDAIVADFQEHCRAKETMLRKVFPDFMIDIREHHPAVPPLDTADDAAIVKQIISLTGNANLDAVSYAAEAGQFAQAGFQSIICGPGSIAQAHRADEYISKEQLRLGEKMIADLIAHCS